MTTIKIRFIDMSVKTFENIFSFSVYSGSYTIGYKEKNGNVVYKNYSVESIFDFHMI